ncbi:MAG: hypothetical protein KAY04_05700 [Burkholderiales bacterium]|nr:hypothetical protein [Burkholderiales bacterium]
MLAIFQQDQQTGSRQLMDALTNARKLPRAWIVAVLSATLPIMLTGCGETVKSPSAFTTVPPPQLPNGVIKLSVVHVVNPRFDKFSDAQLEVFLDSLREAGKVHFDRRIEFHPIETVSIEEYFKLVPGDVYGWRKTLIYDFKKGKGDRAKLEAAYETAIRHQAAPAKEWAAYAAREIDLEKVDTDVAEWKKRFADTHIRRLESLKTIMAADGKPALDESPFNEWLYWNMVGERPQTHDIIITNQLVASAEYQGVDIHSALRGGVTVGTTEFSTQSQFGTQFWWSTFPFTSTSPVIVKMRGGEMYEPLEAARLAGTGAAHELGHQLFHYGHPFGISACLMSPTPMLRFREHIGKLDPEACAASQSPAMKRGVLKTLRPKYASD